MAGKDYVKEARKLTKRMGKKALFSTDSELKYAPSVEGSRVLNAFKKRMEMERENPVSKRLEPVHPLLEAAKNLEEAFENVTVLKGAGGGKP